MVIVIKKGAEAAQVEHLKELLREHNINPQETRGSLQTIIGCVGDVAHLDPGLIEAFDVVESVQRIQEPYKAANRKFHPDDSVIDCAGAKIGGGHFAVIAGPCSVESADQIVGIAKQVKAAGATLLRGGAFKPRTSPYAFQGLGKTGLEMLAAAKRETGLPIVTELMDFKDIELFNDVDVIQIGARNMQNFNLLKEVGAYTKKPILLKRGMSATLQELLMSAEYIMASGNPNVILCERGIRTFETAMRNTLDLGVVTMLHRLSHLPVVVDPSHATGHAFLVDADAVAATAIGADGLIIEVHNDPPHAKCDGAQSQTPAMFAHTMGRIHAVRRALYPEKKPLRTTDLVEAIDGAVRRTPKDCPAGVRVACAGTDGSYAQMATMQMLQDPQITHCKDFEHVFEAVERGDCRYGVLPVENSTAGSVVAVYDLMQRHHFHIVRGLKLKVDHVLLANPGAKMWDIRTVTSHPQAIAQCSAFLKANPGIRAETAVNTAVAAKELARSGRLDAAVIASRSCVKLYGLEILKEGIVDSPYNYTRFICIGRELEIYPDAEKIALLLRLTHRPGALVEVLGKLAAQGVNLTKLESRPIPGSAFEFCFIVEFEATVQMPGVMAELSELSQKGVVDGFTFLGAYGEKG